MEVLEVLQKDFHLFYFFFSPPRVSNWMETFHPCECVSGASFEPATCLKIWRPYYLHYSEKPNHISLLFDRMARVLQLRSLVWEQPEQPHSAESLVPSTVCFLQWQMGTCEENVEQLRPNFPVTIALALWPWGEADSQGGALLGNVVHTCLKRNMWKHSRSAYLGGASLSRSWLATTLLRAVS